MTGTPVALVGLGALLKRYCIHWLWSWSDTAGVPAWGMPWLVGRVIESVTVPFITMGGSYGASYHRASYLPLLGQ